MIRKADNIRHKNYKYLKRKDYANETVIIIFS